jgi:hypothetical protein
MKTIKLYNQFLNENNSKTYYYYIKENDFAICDLEKYQKGEDTFDMNLFDIFYNTKLLKLLGFSWLSDKNPIYFCSFLASFTKSNSSVLMYEKMITNPIIRLYILNETKLKEIKELL